MPWQPERPAAASRTAAKKVRRRSDMRPARGLPGWGLEAMNRVRESRELSWLYEFRVPAHFIGFAGASSRVEACKTIGVPKKERCGGEGRREFVWGEKRLRTKISPE